MPFALTRRDVPAMLHSVAILRSFGFLVNLDKCDLRLGFDMTGLGPARQRLLLWRPLFDSSNTGRGRGLSVSLISGSKDL